MFHFVGSRPPPSTKPTEPGDSSSNPFNSLDNTRLQNLFTTRRPTTSSPYQPPHPSIDGMSSTESPWQPVGPTPTTTVTAQQQQRAFLLTTLLPICAVIIILLAVALILIWFLKFRGGRKSGGGGSGDGEEGEELTAPERVPLKEKKYFGKKNGTSLTNNGSNNNSGSNTKTQLRSGMFISVQFFHGTIFRVV